MWRFVYLTFIVVLEALGNHQDAQVEYGGEKIPSKYLSVEDNMNASDLDYFIEHLSLPFAYFNDSPNDTDANLALSAFFAKSILKRTLLDYTTKLNKQQNENIRKLINMGDNILSHYLYINSPYGWSDFEYKVSRIFQYDDSQIYSIEDFNRNQLKQWILTKDNNVHTFIEKMDTATLSRDEYCKLSKDFKNYSICILDSDFCISQLFYNKEPVDLKQLQKCTTDKFCEKRLFSDPSIGYTLSHRLLNLYLRRSIKRCYIRSELQDKVLMDQLCANMYRETVYLARRGFFARDLFLEHIALCSLLGYEEFHRRNWFYKATSWIQENGCIVENKNFILNSTKIYLRRNLKNLKKRQKDRQFFCERMKTECDEHPTAILLIVLAHAIRYAANFMKLP